MKMNLAPKTLFTLTLISCLASCERHADPEANEATPSLTATISPSPPPTPATSVEQFNKALHKEPAVIDFVYDPSATVRWTIGVNDNGSPRYGYAEYLCGRMTDFNLPTDGAKVRIVDYRKFMEPGGNGREASLGSVDCKSGERSMP
jgi:hypothetical protein